MGRLSKASLRFYAYMIGLLAKGKRNVDQAYDWVVR